MIRLRLESLTLGSDRGSAHATGGDTAATPRTKRLKSLFSESVHLNIWEAPVAVPGKFMISMIDRAQFYEAVALAVFAGWLVLLFTVQIVPALVD